MHACWLVRGWKVSRRVVGGRLSRGWSCRFGSEEAGALKKQRVSSLLQMFCYFRSTYEVLIDADEHLSTLLGPADLLAHLKALVHLPSVQLVPAIKYLVCWPMAAWLRQEMPEEPDGLPQQIATSPLNLFRGGRVWVLVGTSGTWFPHARRIAVHSGSCGLGSKELSADFPRSRQSLFSWANWSTLRRWTKCSQRSRRISSRILSMTWRSCGAVSIALVWDRSEMLKAIWRLV